MGYIYIYIYIYHNEPTPTLFLLSMIFLLKNEFNVVFQQHILHKFEKKFEFSKGLSSCSSIITFLDHQNSNAHSENTVAMPHSSISKKNITK